MKKNFIITLSTSEDSFDKTKLWFLKQWANRMHAPFRIDKDQIDLNFLRENIKDHNCAFLFLPAYAFPNLGAPNFFKKIEEKTLDIGIYDCKFRRSDSDKTQEPFYISGDELINSLGQDDLEKIDYLDLQRLVRESAYKKKKEHEALVSKTNDHYLMQQKEDKKTDKVLKKKDNELKKKKKEFKKKDNELKKKDKTYNKVKKDREIGKKNKKDMKLLEKKYNNTKTLINPRDTKNNLPKRTHKNAGYYRISTSWNFQAVNYFESLPFSWTNNEKIFIYHLDPTRSKIDLSKILNKIKEKLYDWQFLNQMRFRNVEDYKGMFRFTGRNKIGCKEIAKSLGIRVPETFQIVNEIHEIDWKKLPTSYVIKPTNLDGARKVYAVHRGINTINKEKIDKSVIEQDYRNYQTKQMEKELNQFLHRILKPKIIIEEYVKNTNGKYEIPMDYKCYVFRGELKFILVIDGENDRKRFAFYDRNWRRIPNTQYSTNSKTIKAEIPKPKFLEKLVRNAETLGNALRAEMNGCWEGDFLRIDFYISDEDVYFGEFAIFPNGGKGKNVSKEGLRAFAEFWLGEIP